MEWVSFAANSPFVSNRKVYANTAIVVYFTGSSATEGANRHLAVVRLVVHRDDNVQYTFTSMFQYRTELEKDKLICIISDALSRFDFDVDSTDYGHSVILSASTNRPWYSVITRATPQLLAWQISPSQEALEIQFIQRYAKWYAAAVAVMFPLSLILWYESICLVYSLDPKNLEYAVFKLMGFVGSFLLIFTTSRLIRAAGSETVLKLFRAIAQGVKDTGHEFTSRSHRTWTFQFQLSLVHLALMILTALHAVFYTTGSEVFTLASLDFYIGLALIVLLVSGLGGVLILSRRSGTAYRTAIMFPGLLGSIAFLSFQGCALPMYIGAYTSSVNMREILESNRTMAVILCIACIIPLIGVVYAIIHSQALSQGALNIEHDIKTRLDTTIAESVMKSDPFMTKLRWSMTATWLAIALIQLALAVMLFVAYFNWLFFDREYGPIPVTQWSLASIFGLNMSNPLILAIAVSLWTVLVLVTIVMIGLSVVQLEFRRHRLKTWARRSHGTELHRSILDHVNRLVLHARMLAPELILAPRSSGIATSFSTGLRSTAIVIDPELLLMLAHKEFEALIAHELAHHKNYDLIRHVLLQILARVTFLGDGFVSVYEHSYRYELNADRTAVQLFGCSAQDLASCLRKLSSLHSLGTALRSPGLQVHGSEGPNQAPISNDQSNGFLKNVASGLQLWWLSYTGDTNLGYWHPSLPERLHALGSLAAIDMNTAPDDD